MHNIIATFADQYTVNLRRNDSQDGLKNYSNSKEKCRGTKVVILVQVDDAVWKRTCCVEGNPAVRSPAQCTNKIGCNLIPAWGLGVMGSSTVSRQLSKASLNYIVRLCLKKIQFKKVWKVGRNWQIKQNVEQCTIETFI